jgi:hypothetical protein
MVFLVLLLTLLLLSSCYIIYNLYTKYQTLESIAQENVDFIMSVRNRVLSQQSYLKQLDRKGAFESDDETGYFFKELKKIINDIAVYIDLDQEQNQEQNNVRGTIERF